MAEKFEGMGLGWLPDYPDFRDHTTEEAKVSARRKLVGEEVPIKGMLGALNVADRKAPAKVDLRPWCSAVENQVRSGRAPRMRVGVVEYFERRVLGNLDASRLFLYKVTRNLMQRTGDTGSFLRTTMQAMVLFGTPPEDYYPYRVEDFDVEPPAFCYSFAQNYQALDYYRLDRPGVSPKDLLKDVKRHLAAGLPSMFGFTVYRSIDQAQQSEGRSPSRSRRRGSWGAMRSSPSATGTTWSSRTSMGTGDGGSAADPELVGTEVGRRYGWLPYRYVEDRLATDWWCLLKSEWVESTSSGRPVSRSSPSTR